MLPKASNSGQDAVRDYWQDDIQYYGSGPKSSLKKITTKTPAASIRGYTSVPVQTGLAFETGFGAP